MTKVIIKNTGTSTELSVDGVDLGKIAQSFTLHQKAGESPTLEVSIPVDEVIAELSDVQAVINAKQNN